MLFSKKTKVDRIYKWIFIAQTRADNKIKNLFHCLSQMLCFSYVTSKSCNLIFQFIYPLTDFKGSKMGFQPRTMVKNIKRLNCALVMVLLCKYTLCTLLDFIKTSRSWYNFN